MENKSARAAEIDELVQFIRRADRANAHQSLLKFIGRGDRVSREILMAYEQLEHIRA